MATVFKLDNKDILKNWSGSRYGGLRGSKITLIHAPTGLQAAGDVVMGKYNNKQIKALEDALEEELRLNLCKAVAKHLRTSGL